jgi:hypothetical protein
MADFISYGNEYTVYQYVTTTTVTRKVVGYRVDAAMCICLGPGVTLRKIYVGDDVAWSGALGVGRHEVPNSDNKPALGLGFIYHSGEFDQTPDPYLAQHVAANNLPGYAGFAYIIFKGVDASVLSGAGYSFEVERMTDYLSLGADRLIGEDLNPAEAMADVILNNWGAIGVSADLVDFASFAAAGQQYADDGLGSGIVSYAENFGVSLLNSFQAQTRSVLYVDPDTGKIRAKPLRSLPFDEGAAVSLDNSNLSSVQRMEKSGWTGYPTHFKVSFENRENQYEDDYIISINPAITPTNDRSRRVSDNNLSTVKSQEGAAAALSLLMTYESSPRLGFVLQANREAADILPGDPFLISWDEYGLVDYPLFASKIAEQGSTSNYIMLTCQQYNNTQVNDFFSVPEPSQHVVINLSPAAPVPGFVIDAPYFYLATYGFEQSIEALDTTSFPLVFPRPANQYQLFTDVKLTSTGATLQTDIPYALHAKFAKPIKKYVDVETYITPRITIKDVVNADLLVNQGIEGVYNANRLIFTPFEVMSYETFEDNGDGTYDLINVHRAMLDTCLDFADVDDDLVIADLRAARLLQYNEFSDTTTSLSFYSRSHKGLGTTPLELDWEAQGRSNAIIAPKNVRVKGVHTTAVVDSGEVVEFQAWPRSRRRDIRLFADTDDVELWNPDITSDIHSFAVFLIDSLGDSYFLGTGTYGDPSGVGTVAAGTFMETQIPPTAAKGSGLISFKGVRMEAGFTAATQIGAIRQQSWSEEVRPIYIKGPLDIVTDFSFDYQLNP